MLDTVKVFTTDFDVKDDAKITIQPASINYQTGEVNNRFLFRDSSGVDVKGSRAYINDDVFNFTVKPDDMGLGVLGLLQFSPPKVLTGDNYYTLNDSQLLESFKVLQDRLDDSGIRVDLGACRVSRLDACRNAYTEYPFEVYAPLLQNITMARQERRDYGSTYLWHNGQRQVCVYDKNVEVNNRKGDLSNYPDNTIRFEYRLLKGRSVKRATGIETISDIKDTSTIREVYKKAMAKNIFKAGLQGVSSDNASGHDIRQWYRDNAGRKWNYEYRQDLSAYRLLRDESLDALRADFESSYSDKKNARRALNDIVERARRYQLLMESAEGITYADLYQELESKVLAKD